MSKAKNDDHNHHGWEQFQHEWEHKWKHHGGGKHQGCGCIWLLVGIAVLVAVLGGGGIFGTIFGAIGGLIGAIFGFVGTVIGLVFGLIGTIIGLVFGIIGGVLGLVFGLLGLLLPILLIVAGIKLLTGMNDANTETGKNKRKNDDFI
jgi:hypothetical protein